MEVALAKLDEAQHLIKQMQANARADNWDNLQQDDALCRALMDEAIKHYSTLDDEQQRHFREAGAQVLQRHRELLNIATTKLETVRAEVESALRSEKMHKTYSANTER